ncbi:inorganic diphosphatase [Alkaliphilus transvaalensis]|uniref:inorganic diphosphatase n=1 Tax=Alkaliphilus transvaalensis TaxID=114628 RepID=UPI0009FFFEE3|nr:inorganic diphosphatase [Alkaliphilus transvaalensis]
MNYYLGKKVEVIVDRPLGSKHPEHNLIYPINYGYIPNTLSGDGEEIDAYVIGEFQPLESYEGYVVAIIHRKNDNENKLVVSKEEKLYSVDQIRALVEFQERYFESDIITLQQFYSNNKKQNDENSLALDFNHEKKSLLELLERDGKMVLATSLNNQVTARTMSCIILGEKIYFQTDKVFEKYHQIINNPRVALCINNIQIEGVAEAKGHPLDEENKDFSEKFKKLEYRAFEKYSHMENEVLIEVELKLVTIWRYEKGRAFRDYIDFKNKIAYRSYYEHS